MKQILVYGDSLSWGIVPGSRKRLAWNKRWPGVLELALNSALFEKTGTPPAGADQSTPAYRVLENCLNGRRTVWDDPFKPGRNGEVGLAQLIEIHSPLNLVIVMLGTNDFQSMHPHTAWHSAQGLAKLVRTIQAAPVEPEMPIPPVLIIAPPPAEEAKGAMADKFKGAQHKSAGLSAHLQTVANDLSVQFFDAATIVKVSSVDGVHLDATEHYALGVELAPVVAKIIETGDQLSTRLG